MIGVDMVLCSLIEKNFFKYILLVIIGLLLTGCNDKIPESVSNDDILFEIEEKNTKPQDDINKSFCNFSVNLFKTIIDKEENSQKNFLISPISLLLSMNNLALGARGSTFEQISDAFTDGASRKDINDYCIELRKLFGESNGTDLNDSIWINTDSGIDIRKDYKEYLTVTHNVVVENLPFKSNPNAVCEKMNQWINKNTHGIIKKSIDSISGDEYLYIVNTVFFDDRWKVGYEDNQLINNNFKCSDGKIKNVKMLKSIEYSYIELDNAVGFTKDYDGERFCFMALVPKDKDITITEYLKRCSDSFLTESYMQAKNKEVNVSIPEFEINDSLELKNILQSLGMVTPFSEEADFTGMLVEPIGGLSIGRVIQNNFIQVNREGTKAASTTVISVKDGGGINENPISEIVFDRPFVFVILTKNNGTPVYMGIVNEIN